MLKRSLLLTRLKKKLKESSKEIATGLLPLAMTTVLAGIPRNDSKSNETVGLSGRLFIVSVRFVVL